MLELNGELYYKVFECGKIPRYMDPDNRYNEDYIYQVAKNYDPINVHEAPFWIGHPEYLSEPRAGGWIKSVVSIGKELYVSFSQVMPWMKELFDTGEFKKCSVEMGDLEINSDGTSIPYLWALGATNIPAVKGLPALKFDDQTAVHKHRKEEELKNKISFSLLNFDYPVFIKNKEQNKTEFTNQNIFSMNETLKKLADTVGVKYTDDTTDSELSAAIEQKTSDIKAAEAQAKKDLDSYKDAKAIKLVDDAIALGQLRPNQKNEFETFAKSNYELCEKVISALPKIDLTDKRVNTAGTGHNYGQGLKSVITYEDVLNDPEKYIGTFSDEELLKLRENSSRFKTIPILE